MTTKPDDSDIEKTNANQVPRIFYARHMQAGICGYENETVLVDTDAIKRLVGSVKHEAIPVYIYHQKVELESLKEKAAGYVTDSFYNALDGCAWFKFCAIDDEVYRAISQNWGVSNAYVPTKWAPGGTKNNLPFDREVVDGKFTHLAIVPDPRYEVSKIMTPDQFKDYQASKQREFDELQNSKTETAKGKKMFKLFKNKREEVTQIDADTLLEVDGKTVSVQEMINSLVNSKKNSEDEEMEKKKMEKMNADSEVDCDGEKMPLSELVNRYKTYKNSEEDEKKKADEEKKNAEDKKKEDEEKAKKEEEEKKNSKHFKDLKDARGEYENAVTVIETSTDKVARGKARYGSANA